MVLTGSNLRKQKDRFFQIALIFALSLQSARSFVFGARINNQIRRKTVGDVLPLQIMTNDSNEDPLLLVSLLEKVGLDCPASVRLVLASQSPRRREILDMMLLKGKYSVETSPLDESKLQKTLIKQGVTSAEYTCRLAEAKAFALAEHHINNGENPTIPTFYLGSDTVVELDEAILEKPKDAEDARAMLSTMSGREHHVHTGVAIYKLFNNDISLIASFTDTATVRFCSLSQDTINAYVATGEPLDKAGTFRKYKV